MRIKNALYAALATLPLLATSAYAQEADNGATITTTPIVDPSGFQSTLINAIGPWLVVGVGVAVSVLVVFVGYKWVRSFIKRG